MESTNLGAVDNFEVRLYETLYKFDVIYGRVDSAGNSATIGVQEPSGEHFTDYSCYNGSLQAGLLLSFEQPGCVLDTPTSTITPGGPTLTPTLSPTNTATETPTNTPTVTLTPPPLATCGPLSNYIVSQSMGAIQSGTYDIGNHCTFCSTLINLPFNYCLYDQEFNHVRASNNGTLQFIGENNTYLNACLPNHNFNTTIFANFDDLTTRQTDCQQCGIFTSISGETPNRVFNIEWRAGIFYTGGYTNFEIRLYEGQNRFDLVYGQMDQSGSSATVAVQRDNGSRYTQFSCNTSGLVNGLLLVFTQPECPTPTGTPPTATITRTPTVTPTPTAACGPESNYLIATATGTIVPGTYDIGNHCDECLTTITLPFPYDFYGQPFDTAKTLGALGSRLADLVTVQYAKVAEYQQRGIVHFHALIRLDGPKSVNGFAPAPTGLTAAAWPGSVEQAAAGVVFDAPPLHDGDVVRRLRFGTQLDSRPIAAARRTDDPDRALTPEQVAGYLAKYATKSATDSTNTDSPHARRLRATIARSPTGSTPTHAATASRCGNTRTGCCGKWRHMLGFRGHFSTKSRRYSRHPRAAAPPPASGTSAPSLPRTARAGPSTSATSTTSSQRRHRGDHPRHRPLDLRRDRLGHRRRRRARQSAPPPEPVSMHSGRQRRKRIPRHRRSIGVGEKGNE